MSSTPVLSDGVTVEDGLPSGDEKALARSTSVDVESEGEYLHGPRLILIMLGLSLAALLTGLDNSIISTAIPTITTSFNSLDDVGWYGSSFLICLCALQPLSGKIYQNFSLKWAYIVFIAVFELGSLICATAVSSTMLIVGRAVAGMGGAGLFSGALIILANTVPLRQRPVYTGFLAAMIGISGVFGPLLGGAFTEHLSWRWCFYINLPLGGVTILIMILCFRPRERPGNLSFSRKVQNLDLPGILLFVPAVVMLLLALQWGGHSYSWNSATIIGLFIGFGVMMILFGLWQWHEQENASIPLRILNQRNVYSTAFMSFLGLGAATILNYYMPMWFQVIKGATPVKSGIRFLPVALGNVVMALVSGGLVTKFGLFNPWLFLGGVLSAVSGGILSTFTVGTSSSMINGILAMSGMGMALLIQTPLIALMALLPQDDIAVGTTVSIFFQFLGGAVFLAVGENIFVARFVSELHTSAPSLDAEAVVAAGAAGLAKVVGLLDPDVLVGALDAFNVAITTTFYIIAALSAVAFFCAFGVEWRSVKGPLMV